MFSLIPDTFPHLSCSLEQLSGVFPHMTWMLKQTADCSVCWADGDRKSDADMDGDSGKISPLVGEDEFKASCAKEMALLDLMEKTGYNMVQENGQRKYGGPPPGVCVTSRTWRNIHLNVCLSVCNVLFTLRQGLLWRTILYGLDADVEELLVVWRFNQQYEMSSEDTEGQDVFWAFYCDVKCRYRCASTFSHILVCVAWKENP